MKYVNPVTKQQTQRCAFGFTMVELMMVLLLLGIVASIAAPSFSDPMKRNAKNTFADQLRRDISFAKDYAYLKSEDVVVCADDLTTATFCDSSDWTDGWLVYHATTVLSEVTPTSDHETVDATHDTLTFNARGFTSGATITVCVHENDRSNEDVQLIIRPSGYIEQSAIAETSSSESHCPGA